METASYKTESILDSIQSKSNFIDYFQP